MVVVNVRTNIEVYCEEKNSEVFKNEFRLRDKTSEYVAIDEYKKGTSKIRIKHLICNTVFEMTPHNFLNGQGCQKCSVKKAHSKLIKSHNEFLQDIENLYPNKYEFITKYEGRFSKLKVVFKECKHNHMARASSFYEGINCPVCSVLKKNISVLKNKLKSKFDNEFEILDTYKKYDEYLTVRHNVCGKTFKKKKKYTYEVWKLPSLRR